MQMRGDAEVASFRGDKGRDPRAALPQAQPAGVGSVAMMSLPGLGWRGFMNKEAKKILQNRRSQSSEPQMHEPGPS